MAREVDGFLHKTRWELLRMNKQKYPVSCQI